jgi:hypothetical protein
LSQHKYKGQKLKIILFAFFIAAFEHSIICGETANFDFYEQDSIHFLNGHNFFISQHFFDFSLLSKR